MIHSRELFKQAAASDAELFPWWLLPAGGAAIGGISGINDALFDREASKHKIRTVLNKLIGGAMVGGVAEGGRQMAHAGLDTMDMLPPALADKIRNVDLPDIKISNS